MLTTDGRRIPLYTKSSGELTKRPNRGVICQKHANGMANNEDPDQTAPPLEKKS